jgi:predicted RNA binding protein YcfA (HicA-like mRNA interferase family)
MSRLTPQHYQALIKVFSKSGFKVDHQTGSHIIMTKPGVDRPLVIQKGKDVPVFHIKNLLRTAGLSRADYFELLKG